MVFKYQFHYLLLGIVLILATQVLAQPNKIRVKYVSGNQVYLDKGSSDGIQLNDTLQIIQRKKIIARIVTEYVASHSASCRILQKNGNIRKGARVKPLSVPSRQAVQKSMADSSAKRSPGPVVVPVKKTSKKQTRRRRRRKQVRGSIALQFYQFNDQTARNLDFTRPTLRISLKADRLWQRPYFFRIRSRTRNNRRKMDYRDVAPRNEWRNRIYELSLRFSDENAFINWQAGRIISNRISGIGYIDGIMLLQNYSAGWQSGFFAGTQPEWHYSKVQTAIQKYGGYLHYQNSKNSARSFQSTFAAAGEYHGSIVSREYFYVNSQYSLQNKLFIYQSSEIEYNRSWRKEKTGKSFSLTNLYFSARWQTSPRTSFGIQYDNRKNYWQYQFRDLADSLFIDAMRYGWRATAGYSLPHHWQLSGNYGYRKQTGSNQKTHSYLIGLRKSRLFLPGSFISSTFSGFNNPYTKGSRYQLRFSFNALRTLRINTGYGGYFYQLKRDNSQRKNQNWFVGQTVNIFRRQYFNFRYENNWGNDLKGYRIFAELGYRF